MEDLKNHSYSFVFKVVDTSQMDWATRYVAGDLEFVALSRFEGTVIAVFKKRVI